MKNLLFLLLLVQLSVTLSAQKAIMDIHAMFINASEGEGYQNTSSFGGGIGYDFYVNPSISLGLEADYLGFRYEGGDSAVNIIPIQGIINGHWNVSEKLDLYAGTGIGMFWQRYKNGFSLSQSEVLLGMTPRVGLNIEIAQNVFFTSAIKYSLGFGEPLADDASDLLMFSLGIGYNINAEL